MNRHIQKEKGRDRWSEGDELHQLFRLRVMFDADLDFNAYNDYFGWKLGGDGDNGETLMYQMDAYFEMKDETNRRDGSEK